MHNYANIFMRDFGIKRESTLAWGRSFWVGSTERGSQVCFNGEVIQSQIEILPHVL